MPLRPIDEQLLKAAQDSNTAEVRRLLDAGADANAAHQSGRCGNGAPSYVSALYYASMSMWANAEIFKLLLQRGANPSAKTAPGGVTIYEEIQDQGFCYGKLICNPTGPQKSFRNINEKLSNPQL